MRILHVISSMAPRYGGPPKACFEMARALAALGHFVNVYTTNLDGPGEIDVPLDRAVLRDGVEIRFFPIQYPRFWGTSRQLARALRKDIREYDLVHIHTLYQFHSAVAAHYCRKYNVPYLIRAHGMLDPFLYRRHRLRKSIVELFFENRNIRKASAIHFTTDQEKILAEQYTFKTPGIVVPHGLYLEEYKNLPEADSFRSQYPETVGKSIILHFGRLNFKKGLDILSSAFAKVARRRDDAHLVLSGPDNEGYGEKVRDWLHREGVLDRATFTGMLTGEDKLSILKDADVFALPSYSENFGISVVEAMACGVPVVISDKVNIWREVVAGGAGRVAPCNADRFADIILDLLDNPEMAKQMGDKGKTLVKKRFQWSDVALVLENAYRSIISGQISAPNRQPRLTNEA